MPLTFPSTLGTFQFSDALPLSTISEGWRWRHLHRLEYPWLWILHFFFFNKARGHLAFPCDCPIATLSCCRYASIDQWKVQGGFDSGSQTRSAVNKLCNKEPDFLPSCAQHRSQFQSLGKGASSLLCMPDTGWLLSLRSCLKCICSCLFS